MSAVPPLTTQSFGPAPAATGAAGFGGGAAINPGQTAFLNGSANGDAVRPSPWGNPSFANYGNGAGSPANPGSGGGFLGLIQNLLGQLTAAINAMNTGSGSATPPTQNVADANFASTGDPHLSETGTLASGSGTSPANTHFDSMTGHSDLLDSNSFAGGYQLSTTVTTPNASGVTYNQSATVSLNNGNDSVTLNKDGSYSIDSGGTALSLEKGQSLQLAGGAEVSRATDGSLTISESNANGGSITTSFSAQSYGIDVNAQVHNATVGGDIVAHGQPQPAATAPPTTTAPGATLTSLTTQPPYVEYAAAAQPATQTNADWLDPQLSPTPQIPDYEPVSFA